MKKENPFIKKYSINDKIKIIFNDVIGIVSGFDYDAINDKWQMLIEVPNQPYDGITIIENVNENAIEKIYELLPCPFCGKELVLEPYYENGVEILHPSGIVWRIHEFEDCSSSIEYDHMKNRTETDEWCYQICCPEIHEGCGAEMNADSKEEVVAKWNKRVLK